MAKSPQFSEPDIYLGEWLELFGLGPTEAGRIAGCGQSYISNIMSNKKRKINVLFLLRLSQKLGVTINDFYKKPPTEAQVAQFEAYSPQARQFLLSRRQAKG
jgi:transcriptional regulator with XRE-family HTH domain